MAPPERIQLPLRWQFVPVDEPKDRSVRWQWRAYTQAGAVSMESAGTFENLTDCMEDAKRHGYAR